MSIGTFWGETFFFEKTKTYRLPDFEQKFLGPLAKKFGQGCQKWILRVLRNNSGKCFRKITLFFITFGIWVKKCQLFGKNFSAGLSKTQSECPGEKFGDELLFWKKYMSFLIVFGPRAIFLALWREYFITVFQTAFHVSIGRVWAKLFFFEKVYFDSFW